MVLFCELTFYFMDHPAPFHVGNFELGKGTRPLGVSQLDRVLSRNLMTSWADDVFRRGYRSVDCISILGREVVVSGPPYSADNIFLQKIHDLHGNPTTVVVVYPVHSADKLSSCLGHHITYNQKTQKLL
jgi:hypothetical protein